MSNISPELRAKRNRLLNRLWKAQSRADMRDNDLAKLIGVVQSSIHGWRHGEIPTGARVEAIVAAIELLNESVDSASARNRIAKVLAPASPQGTTPHPTNPQTWEGGMAPAKPNGPTIKVSPKTPKPWAYCPSCGTNLGKGWAYCVGCGNKLGA